MKKALVGAYIDNNLGDDLFIKGLVDRYRNVEFSFNYANSSIILQRKSNVKKVELDFFKILKNVRNYDVFILIGGSMFQQIGSPFRWFKNWLSLYLTVFCFRLMRKKVVFMGFNFGPYDSKIFFYLHRLLFRLVNYLSVRDEKTYSLFDQNKHIHFYPDIVFGLKVEEEAATKKKDNIGISIMDFGSNVTFQRQYENFLVDVLKGIDKAFTINVYTFQNSKTINDDMVAQRVLRKVNRDVNIYNYNGKNLQEILNSFSKNEFVLSSRFHSLVLALIFKQSFVSVSYNIKIDNLLSFIGLDSLKIKPQDLGNRGCVLDTIKKINERKKIQFNEKITNLDAEAVKHFEYLDKLFEVKN